MGLRVRRREKRGEKSAQRLKEKKRKRECAVEIF